ncbi:cation-transporting ATPase [Entomoplasma ellychniae]|uniref:Cation-transporting ATPase n=1 Tax=Entomoplasma ellychniae TaxID=2114 RepID=A0A8E2QVN8_9MOLU|nr:cation-translocating P-type ATPase [Entomoplasma ellychniae]PPE04537.1 cation-transporting ATPase [Entomoplasma ellychniae]
MKKIESYKIKEVEVHFKSDFKNGLTEQEAQSRLQKDGKNELEIKKITPWWVILLHSFIEPLQVILMLAAIVSIIAPAAVNNWKVSLHDFVDFIVIMLIVIADAILETVQTVKARKSVDALKSLSKPRAVVLRNGNQKEIAASDLVVGDIVILEAGKYVPAELRIIESVDFMIDESILTGESVPVEKTHNPIKETNMLADMKNIAFMSTFTTAGRAIGVVIKTAKESEIGKISKAINDNDQEQTPLEKKLTKFSYWISCIAGIIGIIVFVSLFVTGKSENGAWISYLMVAITLAIGVIPESLAAVVSITLSFSTKRMAKNNVIVKKLSSVETLGSVNVICTDKTGTLTQNKMTVQKVIYNNKIVNAEEYIAENNKLQKDLLLKALVLPNDGVTEGEERIGDPTELALVDYAELMNIDEQKYRKMYQRIHELPFNSERKLMSTLNQVDDKKIIFTKGAIDQLLKVCKKIIIEDKIVPISESHKNEILKSSMNLSSDALRVLAFAYKETNNDLAKEEDLVFIGAVAMIDPVRKEAVWAIEQAKSAGIDVCMITGDHAITALAIARDLGLAFEKSQVISSDELEKMSDEELTDKIVNVRVFARVNPEHKVRIVSCLQNKGFIVSMTGDGVNDAPSLSKAEIGVAMGITGTDVAKQASDVILTDDNFATIMFGVNEGRNVYQKIKRSITLLMGFNLANVLSILIISLIIKVSPLEATNILFINLIVESCLAIAIGMGPLDNTLMKQKPVVGKNGLLKGLAFSILKIGVVSAVFTVLSFFIGMMATDTVYWAKKITELSAEQSWWQQIKLINSLQQLDDYIITGRTSMFITMVISPLLFAHLIKLSNWKADKKVSLLISKPLINASLIALVLSLAVMFIPLINDKVFKLMGFGTSEGWNANSVWVLFSALGIAFLPFISILLIDIVVFYSYHLSIANWDKNQKLVAELVEIDTKEFHNKEKK